MTPEQVINTFGVSPEQAGYVVTAIDIGISAATALVIFAIGWWIAGWAYNATLRFVQSQNLDVALGRFLASLLRWTLIGASVIAALEAVGLQTTSLVAVFASAGLAVGLALQGTLSHFASGVMILVFRPFTIGDKVTAGGETGAVQEIGLFATTMHTPNNEKIIVPNGAIMAGTIINHTTLGTLRADIPVGVAYGSDPVKVQKILADAAASCEVVLDEPGVAVAFVAMGASSIDFNVMAWCKSADYLAALADVRTACYDALNREGIDIPFPQMVVHNAAAAESAAAK
ncbi:MAG: mechanosensitive ion channel [Myxococcales bacterium]|nr:mechanosensitive ion channel [Myxococcales bacterium]